MTLEQKISQLMIPAFRFWMEDGVRRPVHELNGEMRALLERHRFGGVILFDTNIDNVRQTAELIASIREANEDTLVAVDHEGGKIARLASGTRMPGNMAIGASGRTKLAFECSRVMGRELSAQGFDVDFAPVLDVNSNPSNPVIGTRSFSDDPETVGMFGRAYVEGLHESGILTALKHFPGHGDVSVDSHTGLPCVDRSLEDLMGFELVPFKASLDCADMVMAAHIQYPGIDPSVYVSCSEGRPVYLPASLSRRVITGVLRERLGYGGVVVSDDLCMGAVARHFKPLDAARLAIEAGVDMLLMPVDLSTSEGIASLDSLISGLADMVRSGTICFDRVEEALGRVRALKARHCFRRCIPDEAVSVIGCNKHRQVERQISMEGVTLVKDDSGTVPVRRGVTLVLLPEGMDGRFVCDALSTLAEIGHDCPELHVETAYYGDNGTSLFYGNLGHFDTVIAVSVLSGSYESDASGDFSRCAGLLEGVRKSVQAKGGRFVLVSAQLPYDMASFPDADAVLACYNSCKGTPNLESCMVAVFGGVPISGRLPVSIPSTDGGILYRRGTGIRRP